MAQCTIERHCPKKTLSARGDLESDQLQVLATSFHLHFNFCYGTWLARTTLSIFAINFPFCWSSLSFLAIGWLAAPEGFSFFAVVYFDVVQGMFGSWYGVGLGGANNVPWHLRLVCVTVTKYVATLVDVISVLRLLQIKASRFHH